MEKERENLSRLSLSEFKLATNKTLGYDMPRVSLKVICTARFWIPIYRRDKCAIDIEGGGSFIKSLTLSFNIKSANFVQNVIIDNYHNLQSPKYGFDVARHMLAYFQSSIFTCEQRLDSLVTVTVTYPYPGAAVGRLADF